ncbi:MAG: aminoglycoside phosphotransferase family protein [bacterium]|nr:aminoglycoside phosphotransferase family protein [bacterium]
MNGMDNPALRASSAVAERLGLAGAEPRLMHSGMNDIVHLAPHPIVARVMGAASLVRDGSRLGESLDVAHYMNRVGVPVVPPTTVVDPGPHESDGVHMTLWDYVDSSGDGTTDPAPAGTALRALHDAGADCPVSVSGHTPTTEIRRLVTSDPGNADLARIGELLPAANARLPDLPTQWLHGDAHLGNVMNTSGRALWGDWAESWFGPVAWDLACLKQRRAVFGEIGPETDAALDAYGPYDRDAADAFLPLVTLWIAAWGTAVAPNDRSRTRIEWVANHLEA